MSSAPPTLLFRFNNIFLISGIVDGSRANELIGLLALFRYCSKLLLDLGICFARFVPTFVKNSLNLLLIILGSEVLAPLTIKESCLLF